MRDTNSENILQKDLRMRAALSHSLSKVAGRKTSLLSLDVLRRFTGEGILSAQPRTRSTLFFRITVLLWPLLLPMTGVLDLLRSHGRRAETRCIING